MEGLSLSTRQGDSAIISLLRQMGAEVALTPGCITVRKGRLRAADIDARPIPDLIPPVCILAAAAEGESHIQNARRLRYKESDRLRGIASLLVSLGSCVSLSGDGLAIRGVSPCGAAQSPPWATTAWPCPPPWPPWQQTHPSRF